VGGPAGGDTGDAAGRVPQRSAAAHRRKSSERPGGPSTRGEPRHNDVCLPDTSEARGSRSRGRRGIQAPPAQGGRSSRHACRRKKRNVWRRTGYGKAGTALGPKKGRWPQGRLRRSRPTRARRALRNGGQHRRRPAVAGPKRPAEEGRERAGVGDRSPGGTGRDAAQTWGAGRGPGEKPPTAIGEAANREKPRHQRWRWARRGGKGGQRAIRRPGGLQTEPPEAASASLPDDQRGERRKHQVQGVEAAGAKTPEPRRTGRQDRERHRQQRSAASALRRGTTAPATERSAAPRHRAGDESEKPTRGSKRAATREEVDESGGRGRQEHRSIRTQHRRRG